MIFIPELTRPNEKEIAEAGLKRRREQLDAFLGEVEKRMAAGEPVFGDRNYSSDPVVLIGEVQQELEDVAGWASILWARLDDLKQALRKLPTGKDPSR